MALSSIAGGLIGIALGILVYGYIFPFWERITIADKGIDAIEILLVDYLYLADYENNSVYVKTESGDIYSVHQKTWELLPPLDQEFSVSELYLVEPSVEAPLIAVTHQGEDFQLLEGEWKLSNIPKGSYWRAPSSNCATDWYLRLIIWRKVVDSDGFRFEHALANEDICYVLLDDGELQAWIRTTDAFSLLLTLKTSIVVSAVIGLFVGIRKYA